MVPLVEALQLAKARHGAGQLTEAVGLYQQILAVDASQAEVHYLLGAAYHKQGQVDQAVVHLEESTRLRPDLIDAHNHLAIVFSQLGRLDESIARFQQALRLKPDSADVANNLRLVSGARAHQEAELGKQLVSQGRYEEAVACYQRAVQLQPDFAEGHNNLGTLAGMRSDWPAAEACYRRAIELKPDYADAHGNLGVVCEQQGKTGAAAEAFRRAVELRPERIDAHNSLGIALRHLGQVDAALACLKRAMEINPSHTPSHSSYLLALQYHPNATLAGLATAHRAFDSRHAAPLRAMWPAHRNLPDAERKLRLGFVSADFGNHPVGYFLVRLLENLDRSQVETTCYSDRSTADAMTHRLRAAATHWRELRGLTDEQAATLIHADEIDILFDLAGHTGGNRLLTFARKPAPLAISWAGYVGTTGLAAMDYVLADKYEVSVGAESHYQEHVLRMPDGYVCYDPPTYAPPVSPPPAQARGYVTFGSFNNVEKISAEVVAVWAQILQRASGSRLVLKYLGMNDPAVSGRLLEEFSRHRIDAARLEFQGWSRHAELLAEYGRIDMALDPFPYGGGLTTCEALWMGVPVITCAGETFAGRHALSHLSNVGLTETIATSLDEYVELATALAADLPQLAALRLGLRERMPASPLCDGKRFAENFVAVLRGAWRTWCAAQANGNASGQSPADINTRRLPEGS